MKKFLFFVLILVTGLCIYAIDILAVRFFFSFIIFAWFLFLDQFAKGKIFSKDWLNWPLGHVASMICLLPFFQWKTMQEHTENIFPLQKKWPPPFNVVIFSMKNFWNVKRLWGLYSERKQRRKFIISILTMNLMLMGIIPSVPQFWIKFGPGYLGFLVIAEFYLQKNFSRRIRLSLNLEQE